MNTTKKLRQFSVFALIALAFACDTGTFELGQDYVKTDTYVELIDTVSIELSTFRFDSIQTSGSGVAWVGKTDILEVGTMSSESFFKVTMTDGFSWNNKEIYDSICISLKHSGKFLGDTLMPYMLTVNRVEQSLEGNDDDGAIYNNRTTLFDTQPLATYRYVPRPIEDQVINFRLDDEFGKEIHNFCKENYRNSDVATLFGDFLKGIRLGTTEDAHALLAFAAADSVMAMTLYSHLPSIEESIVTRAMALSESSLQYNHMQTSNLKHQFGSLTQERQMLSSSVSDNMALLHEGNGYYVRVDFPFINELLDANQKGYIVKAELQLYPVQGTYELTELPANLYFHEIEKVNVWGSIIYASDQSQATATLYTDPMFGKDIYYSVDITQYLNNRLTESIVNTDNGITFTLNASRSSSSVNALLFGGSKNKTSRSRLKIYYYYYDKN